VKEPLGIALIGCGTVGGGVARLLLHQADRLATRAGRPLHLRRVIVRDLYKPRAVPIEPSLMGTDLRAVLHDPNVQVAVEVVGGVEWARQSVLSLLAAGKHVVTANKALLAMHGAEVFDAARKYKRCIAFEASVAGGIPIIAGLSQCLSANQILSIKSILNGTCNFILSEMSERGCTYAEAVREAQSLGYAEADPTLDVDGTDAAHKLAILAHIAFCTDVKLATISQRGIANISPTDIRFASELGYVIKLLAEAWLDEQLLALHVAPVLLRKQALLAQVRGPYNAIHVFGDAVGDMLFYGQGAGQMPTASSVVADIIDIAVGRAERTFQVLHLWSDNGRSLAIRPVSSVRSRYYLRLVVKDQPGVLAEVAHILAEHHISIASVMQHEIAEEREDATVQMVILTHHALTSAFQAAAAQLGQLPRVTAPCVFFPVAD
jgi:homoserine dehydrogenase